MSIRVFTTLLFFFLIDLYGFQAFRAAFKNKKRVTWIYWVLHLVIYAAAIMGFSFREEFPQGFLQLFFTVILTFSFPKLLILPFLFFEDIVRGIKWIFRQFSPPTPTPTPTPKKENAISRSQFLSRTALAVAGVPFIGMMHGIVREKYNYKLHRVQIPIKDLPVEFQGTTITQISDIHTGSFDSFNSVKAGIELVNEQQSDFIFFTGDLVNNVADEIGEYADLYKQLHANGGVFSVLGNHDYGDYVQWDSPEEKEDNLKRMIESHRAFGWNIMMNENHLVSKGDKSLAILGVENYGAKARFPKYGKLAEAYQGIESADVKVLLSHDPSHWDHQVRPEYSDIDLMLSGHTHGFQFGIEIPGLVKWSPSQFVYEQWAGHYQKGNQHLYVNRGFGFLGFSGRVGIRPEITVLELVKA